MIKKILEKFGMDGNGKITKTEYNKRDIEIDGKKESVAVVSYRKFIQECNKNNMIVEEISRQANEYGSEDIKIEINDFKITIEVNKKEITHCYY